MTDKPTIADEPKADEKTAEEIEEAAVYRYKPAKDGAFLSGVPRRNLIERDVARLRGRIADVEASPLYQAVKPRKKG